MCSTGAFLTCSHYHTHTGNQGSKVLFSRKFAPAIFPKAIDCPPFLDTELFWNSHISASFIFFCLRFLQVLAGNGCTLYGHLYPMIRLWKASCNKRLFHGQINSPGTDRPLSCLSAFFRVETRWEIQSPKSINSKLFFFGGWGAGRGGIKAWYLLGRHSTT
jgi:hypothetical protein